MRGITRSHSVAAALTVIAAVSACRRAPETDTRMVSEWMHTLYGVIRTERISGNHSGRALGNSIGAKVAERVGAAPAR